MPFSSKSPGVLISEVGPRDGLQAVKAAMSTADKFRWIDALVVAGLREIEVGSFVPARQMPQMADTAEVVRHALTQFEAMGVSTGVDMEKLMATRAPLMAGLPGEPVYGMTPAAGLPKGWRQAQGAPKALTL